MEPFAYASLCDGIGAVHVAWKPFGWRCAWVSEIEPFPNAVVEHHWGHRNLGDMTRITESDLDGPIDLLVGGTPCQSFSVAGLRKGLADPRGNLALRFLQLVGAARPTWVLWENVPGVRSSWTGPDPPSDLEPGREWEATETSDFGCFLDALGQLGYGWAYRSLDAQYFGVPQRRRRVFVVGHLGDWRRAAAVLFERSCLCGYPPPSREAGAGTAHCLARGACGSHGRYDPNGEDYVVEGDSAASTPTLPRLRAGCGRGGETAVVIPIHNPGLTDRDSNRDGAGIGEPDGPMFTLGARPRDAIAFDITQVTSPGNYSEPKPGDPCHPLAKGQHPPAVAYSTKLHNTTSNQAGKFYEEYTPSLQEHSPPPAVAYQCHGTNVGEMGHLRAGNGNETGGVPFTIQERAVSGNLENGPQGKGWQENVAFTLEARDKVQSVSQAMAVRRLTPRECERLQGYPDDYTRIAWRGKPPEQCPDGPRYRALGNSMAVPVMRWIGYRILEAIG